MPTYDYTGVAAGIANGPEAKIGQDGLIVFKRTVDFAVQNLALNDIVDLFNLPAGILVTNAVCIDDTPEGSAATADVGVTTGTGKEYLDAADLNLAAGAASVSGRAATPEDASFVSGGRYLSGIEKVSLKALAAVSTGKVTVVVTALDFRND